MPVPITVFPITSVHVPTTFPFAVNKQSDSNLSTWKYVENLTNERTLTIFRIVVVLHRLLASVNGSDSGSGSNSGSGGSGSGSGTGTGSGSGSNSGSGGSSSGSGSGSGIKSGSNSGSGGFEYISRNAQSIELDLLREAISLREYLDTFTLEARVERKLKQLKKSPGKL
jgi:hypothetical protein